MSGISLLLLHQNFKPEDPIECGECDGLFDLRHWGIEGEEMECPGCGEPSNVEQVVKEQGGTG